MFSVCNKPIRWNAKIKEMTANSLFALNVCHFSLKPPSNIQLAANEIKPILTMPLENKRPIEVEAIAA